MSVICRTSMTLWPGISKARSVSVSKVILKIELKVKLRQRVFVNLNLR